MGLSGMWLLVSGRVGPVAYWRPIGFLWAAARMVLQDILGYKLYAYSERLCSFLSHILGGD